MVLEKRLFCAARDLHNANGQLGNYLSNLPEIVTDNAEKIANETFSNFSYRCKHFTKVMTLKLQLLDHLFSVETINQNAKQFAKMLTSLQTMADTFDDIEFDKDNRRCIKLTPSQYKIMNQNLIWMNGTMDSIKIYVSYVHELIEFHTDHKYSYVASYTDICSYTYVHNYST